MRKDYKHKKCNYAFGCDNSTYDGGWGFCGRHYGAYHSRIKRGSATWEEIKDRTIRFNELTDLGKRYLSVRIQENYPYAKKNYMKVPPSDLTSGEND